jgi:hypothetical protein
VYFHTECNCDQLISSAMVDFMFTIHTSPKALGPTSDEDVRIHHIWVQVSINLKPSSILDRRAGQTLKEIRSDQRSEVIRRE